jgi:hypothetical protein
VEKTSNKTRTEEVVREFTPLGKYRVRLVRNPRKPNDAPILDIREYVSAETFEGFTRRGIRIAERAHLDLLRDTLLQVLEAGGFATPA